MTKLYQPANGTEGMIFNSKYCSKCIRQPVSDQDECGIRVATQDYKIGDAEYPREWIIASDGAKCTAFKSRKEHNEKRRLNRIGVVKSSDDKTKNLFGDN